MTRSTAPHASDRSDSPSSPPPFRWGEVCTLRIDPAWLPEHPEHDGVIRAGTPLVIVQDRSAQPQQR